MEKIYVVRHGFRLNWISNDWRSATGLARDPPLAAYGEVQAKELAAYFLSLPEEERPTAIFSSPYYRCLQTVQPTAQALNLPIHIEHGIAEWYSPVVPNTNLLHPRPADAASLKTYFPEIDTEIWPTSLWYPSRQGETIEELHNRTDGFLSLFGKVLNAPFARRRDSKGNPDKTIDTRRILLVSHAATVITLVRGLTGDKDLDLRVGCCSLSELVRKEGKEEKEKVIGMYQALKLVDGEHLNGGTSREWGFSNVEVEHGRVVEDPGEPGTETEEDFPLGPQAHLLSNL